MDIEHRDFGSSQWPVGRVATGPREGPTSLRDVLRPWCAVMWCDDMGYVFAQLCMHGTCERWWVTWSEFDFLEAGVMLFHWICSRGRGDAWFSRSRFRVLPGNGDARLDSVIHEYMHWLCSWQHVIWWIMYMEVNWEWLYWCGGTYLCWYLVSGVELASRKFLTLAMWILWNKICMASKDMTDRT